MSPFLNLALPIALLEAIPVQAQMLGPLGPLWETNIALTQPDMGMIPATFAQQIHNRQAGASVSWVDPTSGNSGSVTLLNSYARQGRRCQQIDYRISPPQGDAVGSLRVDHVCSPMEPGSSR